MTAVRKLAAGPSTLDLIAKARWKAPEKFPYLGKAIWSLSFVVTDKVPTMAVDKKFRVYVNPEHVRECIAESTDKNKIEVLLAGVIHEALHPTLRHAHRGEIVRAVDKERWNHACFPAGTMLPCGTPIETVATMRRPYDGDVVTVRTQAGPVTTTPDHPFFVRKRLPTGRRSRKPVTLAEPAWLPAQDIEIGDYVVTPKISADAIRDDATIDLLAYVERGTDGRGYRTFANRAVKSMPLDVDTAWLIGLWVAEGSAKSYIQFSLGSHETHIAERVANIMGRCGWAMHFYEDGNSLSVRGGGPVFGRWLREHCGAGAHNKHVPAVIMYHRDPAIRRAFLMGLTDGDGHRYTPTQRNRGGRQWACIGTVSRALAADLAMLLAQDDIGCTYSIMRKGPRQIGSTWVTKPLLLHRIDWCLSGKSFSTRQNPDGSMRTVEHGRWKTSPDGVWTPVNGVARTTFTGDVFNLTTDSGTYVANGLLVHNCDAELVQHIQRAGIRLWSKDLTPENQGWPRGLTAEEYYKQPQPPGGGGGGGQKVIGVGVCCSGGSGATGAPGAWELADGAQGPKGLSEAEAMVVRAAVAEDIRQYAKNNGIGSVPAGLLRWAEQMAEISPIDWSLLATAKVRYYIETRLGPVASYARPSRRSAGGLILPVHRSPRANVVLVGDTSASMRDSDLGKIIAVVYDAVQSLGTIKALGCDTAAVEPVEIRHIEDLREALRGGGGTEMSNGIAKAEEHNPDVIVVVTDGETGWPAAEPNCPVVVVLTRGRPREPIPAWADVIDVSTGARVVADHDDDDYDDSGNLSDDEEDDDE